MAALMRRALASLSDRLEARVEAESEQVALWLPVALGLGVAAWFLLADARRLGGVGGRERGGGVARLAVEPPEVGEGARLGRAGACGGCGARLGTLGVGRTPGA